MANSSGLEGNQVMERGGFKTKFPILGLIEPLTQRPLDVVFGYSKQGQELAAFFDGNNLILLLPKTVAELIVTHGWQECQQCTEEEHDHESIDWDKYIPE